MKKTMVLGLVVLLVIGSAVAAHAKAQKADLKDENGTVGFVIFNNPDPKDNETNIKVVVSLKKGSPITTYDVDFHARCPDTGGSVDITPFGFLTTNPRGKGNWTSEDIPFHLILGVEPGQWEILVTVGTIFTSDTVTLNLKK